MVKTVFTNGCFDVLHLGHFKLLQRCSELASGGCVIVGLNSDASVKRLKGTERPINDESARIFALKAIRWVDDVIVFDQDTPLALIEQIKPDIIVKGGDYRPQDVVGYGICDVEIFNFIEGFSTSRIIQSLSHR